MSASPDWISVLAVDDHPLVREGIAVLLRDEPDIAVVAEASNGKEGIEQFRLHNPDVTLMDLQMPDMSGVEVIAAIRKEFAAAKFVVLTTYAGDVLVAQALRAGARGYLLKSRVRKDLADVIRAVHAGQKRIDPEVAAKLAEHAMEDTLSVREMDVLRLVAGGSLNKEIAAQLFITEETVKSHVANILGKLGANSRTHAVTIAIGRGIIQLEV